MRNVKLQEGEYHPYRQAVSVPLMDRWWTADGNGRPPSGQPWTSRLPVITLPRQPRRRSDSGKRYWHDPQWQIDCFRVGMLHFS